MAYAQTRFALCQTQWRILSQKITKFTVVRLHLINNYCIYGFVLQRELFSVVIKRHPRNGSYSRYLETGILNQI